MIILKIFIVIIAILSAYVFYNYIVEPNILYPLCLIGTNNCIQIEYFVINNSVLIHMIPTGFWIFYDGARYAYTYGHNYMKTCEDITKFEPAYVTDLQNKVKKIDGYKCIQTLSSVLKYFEENTEKKFLYYRSKDPNNFDIYDVLNYLNSKKIINL